MRRIDRLWHILTRQSFTPLGRLDLIRVVVARQKEKPGFYHVRVRVGELLVDSQRAVIDFHVLGQVLLDELYGEVCLKDRVVIDIGAHKGYFAAYALMAGAKAVISYEPEPSNFRCLSHFAESARSRGKAMEAVRAAVSDYEGELPFYMSSESWRHSLFQYEGQSYLETGKVRTTALSTVLAHARATSPSSEILLKIDAEGAECPLLLNSPSHIFEQVRETIFEYHSFGQCSLGDIIRRQQLFGFLYKPSARANDLHILRRPS